MNTKIVLAIIGVALVAAALVGVTTAQLIGAQNTTNPAVTGVVPPCYSSAGGVPTNCLNSTTGQPYCYGYGTAASNQNQNAYGVGAGMMERSSGYGMGCHR